MEVFITEEWSSRNNRVYSLHFNFGLSSPACEKTFNTGSKLYILQFSRFRGFWKNSLHQMTLLEMLNAYFVKQ
jgi:hypothetical protein